MQVKNQCLFPFLGWRLNHIQVYSKWDHLGKKNTTTQKLNPVTLEKVRNKNHNNIYVITAELGETMPWCTFCQSSITVKWLCMLKSFSLPNFYRVALLVLFTLSPLPLSLWHTHTHVFESTDPFFWIVIIPISGAKPHTHTSRERERHSEKPSLHLSH